MRRRRGAIQISIGFVVIIVLAVLILTLGIGWVRSLFTTITEITTQVTDIAKQNLIQNLRKGDDKVMLTIPDKIRQRRGVAGQFGVGIKNVDNEGHCFYIDVSLGSVGKEVLSTAGCADLLSCPQLTSDVRGWIAYIPVQWVGRQDVGTPIIVDVQPGTDSVVGRYIFEVRLFYSAVTPAATCSAGTMSVSDFTQFYPYSKQFEIEVE